MKTSNEMTATINNLVNEAIEEAKLEAMYNDRAVTFQDFLNELDVLLMNVSFETTTTKSMFSGMCVKALTNVNPEFKQLVQPKIGLDINGNYTQNPEKWV